LKRRLVKKEKRRRKRRMLVSRGGGIDPSGDHSVRRESTKYRTRESKVETKNRGSRLVQKRKKNSKKWGVK